MFGFVVKRLFSIIATLLVLSSVTFFMMHSIPGGPFTTDRNLPAAIEQVMNEKYNLNAPLYVQYFEYLQRLLRLDLGPSIKYDNMSVNRIIAGGFRTSAIVGGLAVLIVMAVGVPLGLIAGFNASRFIDKFLMVVTTFGIVIPSFVAATLLLYTFSVKIKIFPLYGVEQASGYVLPAVALALFSSAFILRLTRSTVLDVMNQDYMVTADAKGLPTGQIIFKHALRNVLIPVVTVLGPTIASLLTGTFVIEKIFALPGLGRHFVNSIANRDYTVIMGITLFYALFLTLMVFVVDMLYVLIDPRIKHVE